MWEDFVMEQDPLQSKIIVPEVRESIVDIKANLALVEEYLEEVLQDLNHSLEQIEANTDYLKHMKSSNEEALNLNDEELPPVTTYPEDEIEKTKKSIEKFKQSLDSIRENINKLTSYKEILTKQIEQFEKVEQRFRNLLVSFRPGQEN